jgi:hypothetical protein
MKKAIIHFVACICALSLSTSAGAQTGPDHELVPDKLESKKETLSGWVPTLSLGASVQFSHSSKVVGAQDGETWNIGPLLDFSIGYFGDEHEWRNTVSLREVLTRTPAIPEFVKTTDQLKVESIYLYRPADVPWIGPFVMLQLTTPIFRTTDVRAAPAVYEIRDKNGVLLESSLPTTKKRLTDWFAPLNFKQSAGAFFTAADIPEAKLEIRTGVGARQVFTGNGNAIASQDKTVDATGLPLGTATTQLVLMNRLFDYQQIGGELFAGLSGTITFEDLGPTRPIIYGLSAEALIPFYSSAQQDRDLSELTNVNIEAKVGLKLLSWLSLDYAFRAVRDPLLLDEFQIQNTLLLNLSYALL